MNIKRFVAPDMREALQAIRSSLGADAVMLSSRKTAQGVEVIAAMDYDDRLLAAVEDSEPEEATARAAHPPASQALESAPSPRPQQPPPPHVQRQPAPPPPRARPQTSENPSAIGDDTQVSEYQRIAGAFQAPASGPSVPSLEASEDLGEELKDLRRLLETQLASLAWNDLNRRRPNRARVLRQLSQIGVERALARELADQMPSARNTRDAWRVTLRLLAERLPLARRDLADIGGTFAIVGPTGVGKTTSIAKIAARFILKHRVQDLGLVSTDTYRIGAREQLLTFARILGAPMQVAENARDLRRVLDGLSNKKLVLIDTAGMSQRDVRLAKQFATLRVEGHRVHSVLALSAAADYGSLNETLTVFKAAAPKAVILTKLDEAASLGPALSVVIRSALPVAYLSNGQRVPEDLHLAGPKRLWLIQAAVKLARAHGRKLEEDQLASEFGPMELAANA